MKHTTALLLTTCALGLFACKPQTPGKSAAPATPTTTPATQWTDLVDPMIGTAHSRWFFFTPAATPFGMAKLAPTTDGHLGNPSGWEAVGYDPRHTSIEGFAHFHEFQIGGVVLAPTTGALQTQPGTLEDPDSGYRSRFDKQNETAEPGYYRVLLDDHGVEAELTATNRVGFHRYTFKPTDQAHVVFNIGTQMGESGPVLDASVTHTDDGRIEGWVTTRPAYVAKYQPDAVVTMYFTAICDRTPKGHGTFVNATDGTNTTTQPGNDHQTGIGSGAYLTFDTRQDPTVEFKVGLSYTSVANARLNLQTEAEDLTFDAAHAQAKQTWEQMLGRIQVEGGLEQDRVKFYTGLYHALLGRGLASDVNGAYPENGGGIGQIPLDKNGQPIHHHYNTDAVWGAFWNLSQLWSLAYPEYFSEWVASQLLVYKDSGWLGDGTANSRYVSGVGTNFASLFIASAHNVGIRDYDIALAYEAARKNELDANQRPEGAGKLDLQPFLDQGFSPYSPDWSFNTTPQGSGFAASHTLEYAFSSFAVAQFARQLGHTDDANRLDALAGNWTHLYDDETGLVRPRDTSGHFIQDFDPNAPWIGFQEGNARQYTFYVPHHIERLVAKIGQDRFNDRLNQTFETAQANTFGGGKTIDAFSGLQAVYNHGNQPSLHMSGLFNFSGKPWLSQKWMRTICNDFYGNQPIHGYGYGQDEDQGQLGAWYVMAALGLFDVKGLTAPNPNFQITSPLFDRITIQAPAPAPAPGSESTSGTASTGDANLVDRVFVIETQHNTPDNLYIQSLTLNGQPLNTVQLPFAAATTDGHLVIELGDAPNTSLTQ